MKILFYCLNIVLFLSSLSLKSQKTALSPKEHKELAELIDSSAVFSKGFTGFSLFDVQERQFLYQNQANKYFTPASNVKILSFFAAQSILLDSMPVLFYQTKGDTIQFWGSAYPMLLHPDFVAYDTLAHWLRARSEKVWQFSNANYKDARYGSGWSWDDYPYGFQSEKASLPIWGNSVHFSKQGHLDSLTLEPPYFQSRLVYKPYPMLGRLEDRNVFTFGAASLKREKIDRQLPFLWTPLLFKNLFQDTFKQLLHITETPLPSEYQTLYSSVPDTMYKKLLHDSDNFIAEQLLLQCSAKRYGELSSRKILKYINDTLLAHLPQPLDWVDGSGLSRYNQATPQGLVLILDQLQQRIPHAKLFELFASGGREGTIQDWYAGPKGEAFVFAKTGTLRHIHCLSGYLRSKTGKVYIFSFMHNNYPDSIKELKEEMELILLWLYGRL